MNYGFLQKTHQGHTGFHKYEDITNDEFRTAAYYSIMSESSSFPVDYIKIKNLKKFLK